MQQLVVGKVEILPVDQSFSLGSEIEKGGGRKVMYATGRLPSTPPPPFFPPTDMERTPKLSLL